MRLLCKAIRGGARCRPYVGCGGAPTAYFISASIRVSKCRMANAEVWIINYDTEFVVVARWFCCANG